MFRCDCYPNHEICKNKNTCEFWIPLNQKLKQLNQQISYELKILESLNQRKRDYFRILSEIQRGRCPYGAFCGIHSERDRSGVGQIPEGI